MMKPTVFQTEIGIFIFFFSKQYVSELYHNLSDANKPDLLDLFEKHLGSVVEDIKSRTAENQRLEEALKRYLC